MFARILFVIALLLSGAPAHAADAAIHGVAGGITSVIQGGQFQSGFLAAGVSQFAGPHIDSFVLSHIGETTVDIAGGISRGATGGIASVLGGGKFANGAITSSFEYLYNKSLHDYGIVSAEAQAVLDTLVPGSLFASCMDDVQYGSGCSASQWGMAGLQIIGARQLSQGTSALYGLSRSIYYTLRSTPQILGDVTLSGGRSGEFVRNLIGPRNAVVRGGGERAFVTNRSGQVIRDITADRVKPITPGVGAGAKQPPSAQDLELLQRVLGGGP